MLMSWPTNMHWVVCCYPPNNTHNKNQMTSGTIKRGGTFNSVTSFAFREVMILFVAYFYNQKFQVIGILHAPHNGVICRLCIKHYLA
jgi:hypothetical protein